MFETDTLNILYGVQATGNGHITRSRELVSALKQRGHQVQVIVSGRKESELWGMDAFKPYQLFDGLTLQTRAGRVQKLNTVLHAHPLKMMRDINEYRADNIDLVICDFEPISSRIARKNNIPSIGIGHQYAFQYPIPMVSSFPHSKMILQRFAPVDLGIGLHWHHYDAPILPPIVPWQGRTGALNEGCILVYLPFENHTQLIKDLQKIMDLNFIVYSSQISPGYTANITVKPLSRETFPKDLLQVEGVICNAGFELPSEAITLGKQILVKPLQGQPEQESNALCLKQLNLGRSSNQLTPEVIMDWYVHKKENRMIFPNIVPELVDWIEAGQWDKASLGLLSQQLWSGVSKQLNKDNTSHPVDKNHFPVRNLKAVLV
ncbi:MAG: glycosyltransferase [Candidatus Marinimicrobia bacterium]|nr:glycosyltransferase [Candidatus Neomarinimicrobiota bacterium]MCF7922602.1 glycosyltransferase [Candidatus Neomarinimicrobiota bacterium]